MNVRDYLHKISAQNVNTRVPEESEGKRKMSKAEALTEQQNKNKDLGMQMYKVLTVRSKGLEESRRNTAMRVVKITQKMMEIAMDTEPMFQEFFSNPVCNEDVEMKLELAEANRFEMRIYLKSFPVQEAFQMQFGSSHSVPHGSARVTVNQHMGRVDKMIIKREWDKVLAGDVMSPTKIIPWFSDGLVRAIEAIQADENNPDHQKVFVKRCETGVQLEILPENEGRSRVLKKKPSVTSLDQMSTASAKPQQSVHVSCMACLFGTGLPKGMRLQHPLPNREPYATQGKQLVDQIADEINEGRSLYTLDACLQLDENGDPTGEGHWIINFRSMLERMINGARSFGKENMIDPAIHVVEMISISRNWDIPLSIIETAALWEYKKSANKIRNQAMCFRNILSRLSEYFESKSCPHFMLANFNLFKTEDPAWCDVIAKELNDAIHALDEDPAMLVSLTGVKKKDRRENQNAILAEQEIDEPETEPPTAQPEADS